MEMRKHKKEIITIFGLLFCSIILSNDINNSSKNYITLQMNNGKVKKGETSFWQSAPKAFLQVTITVARDGSGPTQYSRVCPEQKIPKKGGEFNLNCDLVLLSKVPVSFSTITISVKMIGTTEDKIAKLFRNVGDISKSVPSFNLDPQLTVAFSSFKSLLDVIFENEYSTTILQCTKDITPDTQDSGEVVCSSNEDAGSVMFKISYTNNRFLNAKEDPRNVKGAEWSDKYRQAANYLQRISTNSSANCNSDLQEAYQLIQHANILLNRDYNYHSSDWDIATTSQIAEYSKAKLICDELKKGDSK